MIRGMPNGNGQERDGVSAQFRTRAETDLAIEHLVQEFGIESCFIYAEPSGEENSAGTQINGGDHACAMPSHSDRADAPLHGAIQLTVLMRHESGSRAARSLQSMVMQDLESCGAFNLEAF